MWKTENDKVILLYVKLHVIKIETDPDLLESVKKDFVDLYQITENPDPPHTRKYREILEEIRQGKLIYNVKGVNDANST